MAQLPSWPTVLHEINTTRKPNDPSGVDTWVDVTQYVTDWSTRRGRADELADVQAGRMQWTLRNADGRFDPDNAVSPYFPNLKPNRQGRVRATWAGITYDLFRGYESDGWPQTYSLNGRYGWATASFTDAIGPLSQIALDQAWLNEVFADGPVSLYPLSDPAGTTNPIQLAGFRTDAAQLRTGATSGIAAFGAAGAIPTSTNTGLDLRATSAANGVGYNADQGAALIPPTNALPNASASGFTVEFWVRMLSAASFSAVHPFFMGGQTSATTGVLRVTYSNGTLTATLGNNATTAASGNINDGRGHHVAVTVPAGAGSVSLYVDGTLVGTSGVTPSPAVTQTALKLASLGAWVPSSFITGADGVYSGLAFYALPLSATRVTAHYNAGKTAFAGDKASTRVTRILDWIGWLTGLRSIGLAPTPDSGDADALLGPATLTNGQTALAALQAAANSTNSLLDVDGAGRIRYRSRDYKTSQTAPTVTFGENPGEVPYLGDITFDGRPDFLYAQVEVDQTNGVTIRRSQAADTATRLGVLSIFERTLTRSTQAQDPAFVIDLADLYLRLFSEGRQRCRKLTVNPAANPNIWPQVLGLDYGSRVRVNRRMPGNSVGITKTVDCYVESISHQINAKAGSWLVTFELSPVPSQQGWVLGDSTFGVLGSSTVTVA